MKLYFLLGGDGCAGASDCFCGYDDPDESSPSKDGKNVVAAGGKRGSPKKQEAGAGINAPREQNGRFVKVPTSSKCAGKPLTMKTTCSETPANDAEAYTHITNLSSSSPSESPAFTDSNIVADASHNAFSMPLPSELVSEIFKHSILPHLKTASSSEMQMLVCKNIFMKHYCPSC